MLFDLKCWLLLCCYMILTNTNNVLLTNREKAEDSGGHPRGVRSSEIRTRARMEARKMKQGLNQGRGHHRVQGEPLVQGRRFNRERRRQWEIVKGPSWILRLSHDLDVTKEGIAPKNICVSKNNIAIMHIIFGCVLCVCVLAIVITYTLLCYTLRVKYSYKFVKNMNYYFKLICHNLEFIYKWNDI